MIMAVLVMPGLSSPLGAISVKVPSTITSSGQLARKITPMGPVRAVIGDQLIRHRGQLVHPTKTGTGSIRCAPARPAPAWAGMGVRPEVRLRMMVWAISGAVSSVLSAAARSLKGADAGHHLVVDTEAVEDVHLLANGAVDGRVAGVQANDVNVLLLTADEHRLDLFQSHGGGVVQRGVLGDQADHFRADQRPGINADAALAQQALGLDGEQVRVAGTRAPTKITFMGFSLLRNFVVNSGLSQASSGAVPDVYGPWNNGGLHPQTAWDSPGFAAFSLLS